MQTNDRLVNAMSVDVEDWFQVSAFERRVTRESWYSRECRVEANVDRILELFDQAGVKATFFTLGWIAERYPEMVERIADQGHEIASHGWSHVRVVNQDPTGFRDDVMRTKDLLEQQSGQRIQGYRAASYSIGAENFWALEVLEEAGHLYSSSIFPVRHDLYGMPEAPRFAFRPNRDRGFVEFPLTTLRLKGKNLPCAGGGWFRLLPYELTRWALRRVNYIDRQSAIFYFHPWELDPDQPRLDAIPLRTRFRHYLNLTLVESRLKRLLADFSWGRIDNVLLPSALETSPPVYRP